MKDVFETERLILRRFAASDAAFFYALNLNEEVMRYTGDVAFESVVSTEAFIESYDQYEINGFGRMTVVLKSSGEPIGWCGLKRHASGMVDLGYRFAKEEWGNGYATEASLECIKVGFEELGVVEIIGRTAKDNFQSIRVLEKCGMVFWKEAPCEGIENSVFYRIKKG